MPVPDCRGPARVCFPQPIPLLPHSLLQATALP
jgi:hypothetical protein